ncbi:MAG: hypothetical protein EXR62_00385 [Chloroflexi bacterium]|nr:hypothetical protein [Chloroflexota bacterium]
MKPTFLIIGAGAVGSWVGGTLAMADFPVVLVNRHPRYVEQVNTRGLTMQQGAHTWQVSQIRAYTSLAEAFSTNDTIACACLTVKSFDTALAAVELIRNAPVLPLVWSLQNGIGNEEILADHLGPQHVIAGTFTLPVEMPQPGVIRAPNKSSKVGIANFSSPLMEHPSAAQDQMPGSWLYRLLTQSQVKTIFYRDYRAMKWSKLLLNMMGNASAAILGWKPQQVYADPQTFRVEYLALREALAVMYRQGIPTVNVLGYPVSSLAWALQHLPSSLVRPILLKLIGNGRGGKPPSLALDALQQRPRSEVEYLNGAVARFGAITGVPTPANTWLSETLMALVSQRQSWADYHNRPDRFIGVAI